MQLKHGITLSYKNASKMTQNRVFIAQMFMLDNLHMHVTIQSTTSKLFGF